MHFSRTSLSVNLLSQRECYCRQEGSCKVLSIYYSLQWQRPILQGIFSCFSDIFSIGILSLYTLCIKIVRQHSFFLYISIIISEFHIFFYQNDTKKTTFGKNEILCGKPHIVKEKKIIYIFCHTKIYLVKTLLCDCNSLDCIMYVPK